MKHELSAPAIRLQSVLPGVAIAFATAIFAIDTFTALDIAIAVLYVAVVLMSVRFCERRGILLISAGCIALTLIAFALSHDPNEGAAVARCIVSICAIAITAFLSLRIQATTSVLREQAQLLDLTHDTIFVRDMKDVITYWNRGAEELYGWPREEAIGRISHELLQTRFPVSVEAITAELLRADRWEGELVHTKRDGARITASSRWSLQRDERAVPVAILETNTDITERKRAEAKARQQEQEIQLTIDSIPALAWKTRADGFAEYLNKRWLDYTGLSMEASLGWSWASAIDPQDLPRLLQSWEAILAAGGPAEVEARMLRFDGASRWFLFRCEPLRDETGKIVRWYGTNTDIEDRKQAETGLRRSEAYMDEAQRLSQTGSFAWKIGGGDLVWSRETYQIAGLDSAANPDIEAVIERTHPDDRDIMRHELDRMLKGEDCNFEQRLLMPDGSIKHLSVRAHRVTYDSGDMEIVGALTDVTAVKQAQEALHQAQAELAHATRVTTLGQLTASIAHEVNQPLAAIVTNGEASLRWLAGDPPHLDEGRAALKRIINDAIRASEIVRRIRGLAMKSAPEMGRLDINDIIHETVQLVRRAALTQRVAIRLDLAPALPIVFGDRVQLQQVLLNLMMNGVEAMSPAGQGPREVLIRSCRDEIGQVLIAVQDFGVGIEGDADRLFDPFFTTKREGLGMGLSICRSIVQAHGGRIWAASNAGPGATVQFTLPSAGEEALRA